ncbi:MAG: outer membrane lipoprotein carrier protein LolA [Candidatus Acidiferrales bacterium]
MISLAFFLTTLFPSSTPPRSAREVARAIDAHYHHAQTLRATFYERYSDGNGAVSAESGTVYFSKPGRMRWEYESPEQKLFIVDGANAWFYVPADRTASRAKVAESSDWRTPLAFLAGKTDLARLCQTMVIVDSAKAQGANPEDRATGGENTVLRCAPRYNAGDPDEQIREVLLEVDPDARLVRVVIRQPGKLETEFRFANWQENLSIPETKFHFDPPSGVAIVDESALAGALH